MKTPFSLQEWLKDKSQKIETGECCPVRIVDCDVKPSKDSPRTILALVEQPTGEEQPTLYYPDGRLNMSGPSSKDLFFITPDPELTEFEKALLDIIKMYTSTPPVAITNDGIAFYAKKLLTIARKEVLKDKPRFEEYEAVEDGNATGLRKKLMNDNERVAFLKNLIRYNIEDGNFGSGVWGVTISKQDAIDMVDSIHSTWKPTEKQMGALLRAEGVLRSNGKDVSELVGLYEQLRML